MSQLQGVTLNVSQAAEISYNVGIMSRNTGTVDGGKDLKEKRTGAKDRGRKGSWRVMREIKKQQQTTGFITLPGFGPVHVDWLTVLGHIDVFLSLPFLSLPFLVPEQVSPKAIRCCQARQVYV